MDFFHFVLRLTLHPAALGALGKMSEVDPNIDLLLDFLATNSRGRLQPATTWIKVLRFVSRRANLESLRRALLSDVVSAYASSGSIVVRREIAPPPLRFVLFLSGASWTRPLRHCSAFWLGPSFFAFALLRLSDRA